MKFNLYPNRNKKVVAYIAIIVIILEVISLTNFYLFNDLSISTLVVGIIIILAMLLLIPPFRKIIFGEDPYILNDDEKIA